LRSLALAGSAVTLAAVAAVLPAAPAGAGSPVDVGVAVDCSVAHQNRSAGNNYLFGGEPIRSGPHAGCRQLGVGPLVVYLDCWVRNTAGNIWWFVRAADGSVRGWAHDPNLRDNVVRHESNRCLV